MKAAFILFHGFEDSNGISKKIRYQVKALKQCGVRVTIFYFDFDAEGNYQCYMEEDDHDPVKYHSFGKGILGKIKKRCVTSNIDHYVRTEDVKLVYIRSFHNANPFTLRMVDQMKKYGAKIVMEIPTYPYDQEYITRRMKLELMVDKLFRHRLAKKLDAIITFSNEKQIFGKETIRISNGIDFDSIPLRTHTNDTSHELHLIGVAEVHYWHGYDRLVCGMAEYYRTNPEYKVYFHIVGELSGERERNEILTPVRENKLEPYIVLHGAQHGEALDQLFDKADFAIGSLGRHRSGITHIKTLKNREYAARGFGFIYSETDDDFEQMSYILKASADDTPVDIQRIIDFTHSLTLSAKQIRESIEHLSWNYQMKKILTVMDK